MTIMKLKKAFIFSTTHIIMLSFLGVIFLGSLLLCLPVSAADHVAVPYLDALFTPAAGYDPVRFLFYCRI